MSIPSWKIYIGFWEWILKFNVLFYYLKGSNNLSPNKKVNWTKQTRTDYVCPFIQKTKLKSVPWLFRIFCQTHSCQLWKSKNTLSTTKRIHDLNTFNCFILIVFHSPFSMNSGTVNKSFVSLTFVSSFNASLKRKDKKINLLS